MAGRTIDYLIRLIPDTTEFNKVREKIKQIDMGEFIQFTPTEAKKLKKVLEQEINDVGAQAGKLGKQLKHGLDSGLSGTKLQEAFDIDTKKLKETMEIVDKLTSLITQFSKTDSWLKDGSGFLGSLSGAEQKLGVLEASLEKLDVKFNGLDTSLTNTMQRFDDLEKKIEGLQSTSKFDLGKTFNVSGVMQTSMRALKATEDEIHKATGDLKEYSNLVTKLKSEGAINIKLGTNIKELDAQMKEWQDKADALVGSRGKKQKADYNIAIKNIMAIEEARLKLGARPTEDYVGDPIKDVDFPAYEKSIKRFIQTLEKDINALREKINNVVGESFAEEISKQLSNIKIDLVLDEKSKASFKNELNTFIENLNKDKITSAKVNVDWTFNKKEANAEGAQVASIDNIKNSIKSKIEELNSTVAELEKSKQHFDDIANQHIQDGSPKRASYAQGESNKLKAQIAELKETIRAEQHLLDTSDDPATRNELTSMFKSFKAVQQVVDAKQGEILSKTHQWRQKMIDAMKLEKSDVNIQLGFDKGLEASADNLYNFLQQYFIENQIELHINKDTFIQEIKDAVEQGGVSVGSIGGGGGTVNLNPQSLKSAIAEGLLAALTGEFTPIDSGATTTQIDTTHTSKKNKSVYLDPNSQYMKHMIDAVRSLAEYSQKENAQASKVRSFFDMKNVDLKSMVSGSPMDVADMLSQLIEKYGVTLLDDFDNLIKNIGKNRVMQNFRGDLAELLHSQNVGQRTITDEERRLQSIDVFKDLAKKSQMLEPFNIKNPKWKAPGIEDFNEIFVMATNGMDKNGADYLNVANKFTALQNVIANEDGLDGEAQKERLQNAIVSFRESIAETYDTLYQYVSAYEMDVFVKGAKKPYRVSGRPSALRARNAIGDDDSKIEDVRIYKDISTGTLGTTGRNQELKMLRVPDAKSSLIVPYPDRTDILNREAKINDFVESENTVKRWTDENSEFEQAAKRASQAAELLAKSESKATELAQTEAELEKQIEAKSAERQSLENQIAKNQNAIAKESISSQKLAGARRKIVNRKTALDTAKAELDAAKLNQEVLNNTNFSERDKEAADINIQRARYESWQKNIKTWLSDPDKYNEDYNKVIEELYSTKLGYARGSRSAAKEKAEETRWKISTEDNNIRNIQSDINQFGETPEYKRKLEIAKKQRELYVKYLREYEQEYAKQDAEVKRIEAKILGSTDADKEALLTDLDTHLSKRFKNLEQREKKLGKDPRVDAGVRLAKAEKDYQKAQREYDKVESSDEVKRAAEIDQLRAKNQELESRVATLSTELQDAEQKKAQIGQDKKDIATTSQLSFTPQKEEINALLDKTEKLSQDIYQAKKDAEEVDKKVKDAIGADGYKKQEYDIQHTKGDKSKLNRYYTYFNRANDLTDIINDKYNIEHGEPKNLTANMKKIVESLTDSRSVLKALSADFGLDKFGTDDALIKDVKARLSRSSDGTNKLHPIIEEFYNKILTDGRAAAEKWLQSTKTSHSKNVDTQKGKLTTLAQSDATNARELESAISTAEKSLSTTFHNRVDKWLQSIQKKIALLQKGGLKPEDEGLLVREIDELFGLVQQADGQYSKHYKGAIEPAINAQKKINIETSNLVELEKLRLEAYDKGDLKEEQRLQKQIKDARKQIKYYKRVRKSAVKKAQPWSNTLLDSEQNDLMKSRRDYIYGSYLSKGEDQYTTQYNATRSELDAKLAQREPVLQTRQAELLREIEAANKSGQAYDKLEAELKDVNAELAKYAQYHQQVANDGLISIFQDDIEFINKYKTLLAEVIQMEQQADLAKAQGVSGSELSAQYTSIDAKKSELTSLAYNQLQTKQTGLLRDIDATSKEGKNTAQLETALEAVNKELVEYELNQRRIKDTKIDGIAYKADVEVMRVYNEETRKAIELEQKLALARAKNEGVEDALSEKRSQERKRTNNINRAQEGREAREGSANPRVQALQYLRDTERAYATALEQRETLARRIGAKEAQIDDIENDNKYSTSWQYKSHQKVVKNRLVNEYVGSDKYHEDRARGFTNVESEMRSYLEDMLPPEAAEKVLYQMMQTIGKRGDKINPGAMQETFDSILKDNVDYQKYMANRETEYNRILNAPRGSIDTGNSELNLMIDSMHKYRDALEVGAEEIEATKKNNIKMLESVSEADYAPLKAEMQKVKSRVNLDAMQAGFMDVINDPNKTKSREATINNLKSQVINAGGNQTEANRLAEELNQIGDSALKDVSAWSRRFLPQIFHTTEDQFREEARHNLIANEETYAKTEIAELQKSYNQSEKIVSAMFKGETNRGADSFVNKYLGDWVGNLLSDDAFRGNAEGKTTEIVSHFKSLMDQYVYSLVSNYGEGLVVKDGMLGGINIREEVRKMLLRELDILQEKQPGIDTNIAHIEAQRKAAMKFGGIGYNEVADTDVLKEQAVLTSRLTAEKEKQRGLQEEISRLEKVDGSAEELGHLNKALDETNQSIARLQMLVNNRDTLLNLQHQAKKDAQAEQQWTPEQQKLWLTNKLEVAKTNLDSGDESVRKEAERQITRYTEMLNKLETKMATEEAERRKDSSFIGLMTKALRDAFGGKGGFALDASGVASEATLSQILQVLTGVIGALGGQVVRDPEMENKLARMRELEAKRGIAVQDTSGRRSTTQAQGASDKTSSIWKEVNAAAKAEYEKATKDGAELSDVIKKIITEIKPLKEGSKDRVVKQVALQKAITDFQNKNKDNDKIDYTESKKGEKYHSNKDIAKYLGIGDDINLKMTKSDVEKLDGFAESKKQLENEKAKTAEAQKQVDSAKTETVEEQKQVEIARTQTVHTMDQHYNNYQRGNANDFLAVHNMRMSELTRALNIGGLVKPSTAVVKAQDGHTGFGEISALLKSSAIDPSIDKGNKLYGADAWTPTLVPLKKDAKFDTKETNSMVKYLNEMVGLTDVLNLNAKQFKDQMRSADGSIYTAFAHNTGIQTAYAKEKGLIKDIPLSNNGKADMKSLQAILESKLNQDSEWRSYKEWLNAISDRVIKSYSPATAQDYLKHMGQQPAMGKSFRLSANGSLVVPTVEYKTFDQMYKNSGRLDRNANVEINKVAQSFLDLAKKISTQQNKPIQDVVDAINKAFAYRYDNKGIVDAFNKSGIGIAEGQASQIANLYHKTLELPTPYFEAKPGGVVDFDSIAQWILPDNIDQAIKDAFNQKGLKYSEYKAGNHDSWRQAQQNAINAMFSSSKASESVANTSYLEQVKNIISGITAETKGTENSLSGVTEKISKLANTAGGIKAFDEFKQSLLQLQAGKGSIEDTTQKAQKLVEVFAGYRKNRIGDLNNWFGKDVQADATSLLGIVKQLFELINQTSATTKAAKRTVAETSAKTPIVKENKGQPVVNGGWTNAEKAEYDRLAKETEGYSAKVVFGEGGNLGGLALESTLQEILTAIRNIQTNGAKKGGSGSGATKNKNKSEADLIRDRALGQDAAVRGLAAGRGNLYDKYVSEVDALNKAVDAANKAKKNKQQIDIASVKAAAEKVSALTRNILRDTAEWDYITAQSDAVHDYKLPKGQKMTKELMEKEAQKIHGTNKKNAQYKYDFLGFNGDTLTYQLTDIEGKVRQVTMVWNDFNQQLAITSDKSVSKLDPLAAKVEKIKEKFEDAKNAGYLNANDADLQKFINKLSEISTAKTFEDVERLRKEAIALSDQVNKTIRTNRGWMVGNGAKKQTDNQYNKIQSAIQAGNLDEVVSDDSSVLKNYLSAYNQLNIDYEKYVKSNEINNPKIQQQLQQQANAVQILGKKYLTSVQQASELQSRVENSGTFRNVRTGEELNLGGVKQVTTEEVENLKTTMRNFVENGLMQANIEGVKYDNVNQRMTYAVRLNNEEVAKMVVQYNDATQALYAYNAGTEKSLTGIKGFINDIKKKGKSILSYLTYTTSIYRLISMVRQGINYVKEIDSAMTELKKVTDETEESYNRFLKTAAKTADEVGSTVKEIVSSTADWARIGYSLEDASRLAESTAILLNVSEFQSIDDATSALTSTLQAFGYTANQSMEVVDVMNEVGKLVARR